MVEDLIAEVLRRHERMKGSRYTFDSHWHEVAQYVLPDQDYFQSAVKQPGSKNTQRIFDDTAVLALPKFAAAMESMLTPVTQQWHGLQSLDPEIDSRSDVRLWCENASDVLYRMRQSPLARFQANISQVYRQLGAFGNGVLFVSEEPGAYLPVRYKAIDLAKCWWLENFSGVVDTVHREWKATARQIAQQFGEDAVTPAMKTMQGANSEREFTLIHAVRPTSDDDVKADYRKGRWAFHSCYVCQDTKELLNEGGYLDMPYCVGRFDQAPMESYGRGPAMMALADIKMINEMMKTTLRAAHLAVQPPLLLAAESIMAAFSTRPNALNYGGMSGGQRNVEPLMVGARLDISLEMMNQVREAINIAFYIPLFQVLIDKPGQMTAYEAGLRAQEKGQLLGPAGSRIQSDLLGPLVQRELKIAIMSRKLPPMPDALLQSGGPHIEYVSPLNMAQRTPDGVALLNWMQAIAPLAQVDPSAMDVLNVPSASRGSAEVFGVPEKWLHSPEELAQKDAQRAQQAQAAQLLAAAPVAASAAKDAAQAHATMQSVPGPMTLPMEA